MDQEGFIQWYEDNWGLGARSNTGIIDTAIDSLAGKYEILADLINDEYKDMPTDVQLGDLQQPSEKLFELIQTGTPNIRDYNAANSDIIPPADWLERVADLFKQTPKADLPFWNELKDYLDSAATAIAAMRKHGTPLPVVVRTRLQIDTFLLKSAVVEHVDSEAATDLLQTIKANF